MRPYFRTCLCLLCLSILWSPAHAVHTDRVLNDLIEHGRFVGNYVANSSYQIGDVSQYQGRYYFCYAATANSAVSPAEDTAHFDLLPLVDTEDVVVDDSFDYGPGPLSGRQTVEGFVWGVTGAGYLNAYVDPGGFLSSSGNSYYLMRYLPGPITEFGIVQSSMLAPTTATMAISPNNLENNFSEMWHVNWYNTFVGASNYWHDGATGVPATYKFSFNAGLVFAPGSPHDLVLKIRGNFLFGYLDGQLAFIELSDMFGLLTAAGNAVYAQNHPTSNYGQEKIDRVWIKVSSDSDGDGIRDNVEFNVLGTDPLNADTDDDGLVDGSGGLVPLAMLPNGIDINGDGYVDGEQDYGTDPTASNIGDVAPRGYPNNAVDLGDLLILTRLALGAIQPTALEAKLADVNHDNELNAADILLLSRSILNTVNN